MSDRLAVAVAELVAALRDELAADLARDAGTPERLLSIPAAAAALSIGRTAVYSEIQSGRLRSLKVGRRRLVPASALAAYIGQPR
jgi:excisionase family DNA binding protein